MRIEDIRLVNTSAYGAVQKPLLKDLYSGRPYFLPYFLVLGYTPGYRKNSDQPFGKEFMHAAICCFIIMRITHLHLVHTSAVEMGVLLQHALKTHSSPVVADPHQ